MTAIVRLDLIDGRSHDRNMMNRKKTSLLLLIIGLVACATPRPPVSRYERMDPLVLQSRTGEDGTIRTEIIDPVEIYERADTAMQQTRYLEAAQDFVRVADLIPTTKTGLAARFNAGLCYEYALKPTEAAMHYRLRLEGVRSAPERATILYRLATVQEQSKNWPEAIESLTELRTHPLSIIDEMDVRARLGQALFEHGDLDAAETELNGAVTFWKAHQDIAILRTGADISKAKFTLASILEARFNQLPLRLPVKRMKEDLKMKIRAFKQVQTGYLEVVRHTSNHYAARAGHAIGTLYENMYDQLMRAEVPENFSESDYAIYYEELRKKIRPLLFRAAEIYRTNLDLAVRAGNTGEWVRESRASVEKIKTLIRESLKDPKPHLFKKYIRPKPEKPEPPAKDPTPN